VERRMLWSNILLSTVHAYFIWFSALVIAGCSLGEEGVSCEHCGEDVALQDYNQQ
jgi:hypothetical protein